MMIELEGSRLEGVHSISIHWNSDVQHQLGEAPPAIVAFIDNITFHPVREPSTRFLVSLGLAALVTARLRRRSRPWMS